MVGDQVAAHGAPIQPDGVRVDADQVSQDVCLEGEEDSPNGDVPVTVVPIKTQTSPAETSTSPGTVTAPIEPLHCLLRASAGGTDRSTRARTEAAHASFFMVHLPFWPHLLGATLDVSAAEWFE